MQCIYSLGLPFLSQAHVHTDQILLSYCIKEVQSGIVRVTEVLHVLWIM